MSTETCHSVSCATVKEAQVTASSALPADPGHLLLSFLSQMVLKSVQNRASTPHSAVICTISLYRTKSEQSCCVGLASAPSDTIPTCCLRVPWPSFQPSKHKAGRREKGDREIEMILHWVASVCFPPHQSHWMLLCSHIKAGLLRLEEGMWQLFMVYVESSANPGFPKHMLPAFPTLSKYPNFSAPQTPHPETGHWEIQLHIQETRYPVGPRQG